MKIQIPASVRIRIRRGIPAAAVAISAAIGYFWFLVPMKELLYASSQQAQMQDLLNEKISKIRNVTAQQKKELRIMEEWKGAHDKQMFSSDQTGSFFTVLEKQAYSYGCRITSIEFSLLDVQGRPAGRKTEPVMLRGAAIEMHGNYAGWTRLVEWLETYPQMVFPVSLSLKPSREGPGTLDGTLELCLPILMNPRETGEREAHPKQEN